MFRLFDRFLQRAPVPLLQSPIIGSIVDCAIMACSLDHRDANSSVMKFFYDLLNSGRIHKVIVQWLCHSYNEISPAYDV